MRFTRFAVLAISVLLAVPANSPSWAAPVTLAAGAASVAQAPSVSPTQWDWPLDQPRTLIRPYRAPPTPYAAGHRGIDIGATVGAVVLAPEDGVVHFAGVVVDRPVLSIRHAGGLISSFEPVESPLTAGAVVSRGDVIGFVATRTSAARQHCSVSCLHFGVRLYGEYVSPLKYLGGIPHSVLLPTRYLSGGHESARSGG